MEILSLGDSALLIRLAEAPADAVDRLHAAQLPGIVDLVPSYTTIGVFYDPTVEGVGLDELRERIANCLTSASARAKARVETRVIEIPVCYDPEFALDLEVVARRSGLAPAEVIARHSAAEYRVSAIGFTPGFPYLSGLPRELATPRRGTPRTEVPAGAVAIGGTQTGVYPRAAPGGWNIIGRTAMRFFDVERDPPALLRAGDTVRFRAITRSEYDATTR